jgi:hypothetical protein
MVGKFDDDAAWLMTPDRFCDILVAITGYGAHVVKLDCALYRINQQGKGSIWQTRDFSF